MRARHDGKVAIVTGASSGIGYATALAMADAGMDLLISARRAERLESLAAAIRARGRRAGIVVADAAECGLAVRLLDEAERLFGRFDIVFANAGYGLERPIHEMTDAQLRTMFEVNFFAATDLLRHAAQRLIAQKRGGHLLMTSSCLSKFSMPDFGAYAATKAAQESICRAMRFELAPHGIEVASVHPISTTTEFFEKSATRSGTEPAPIHEHAPAWLIQSPERVARAVLQCIDRPRSEVWTSRIVQASSALFTLCPWILDAVLRREARRQRRRARARCTA